MREALPSVSFLHEATKGPCGSTAALDATSLGTADALLKHFAAVKQSIVTLDIEGVFTPEIWIAVAAI